MSRQYFADTLSEPVNADFATITATTETVLIPTAYTPIPAFEPRAGKVYELWVGGTVTTGASGTLTITVRHALTATTPVLATSGAQTTAVSVTTAPFIFHGLLAYRTIGLAGTNSTAVFTGSWHSGGVVATAGSETAVLVGTVGAAISVDITAATALWVGVTFTTAPSVIPKWHVWRSLN
jgi:hypothetical protein